jgi:hypothetical protein
VSNRSWTSGTLIKVGVADFLNDIGKEAICLCLRRNLVGSFASLDFFPRDIGTEGEGLGYEEDEEANDASLGEGLVRRTMQRHTTWWKGRK